MRIYRYLGDRWTDPALRGKTCVAVTRRCGDGKCITGRGSMLVLFEGEVYGRVVMRRLLRKGANSEHASKDSGGA